MSSLACATLAALLALPQAALAQGSSPIPDGRPDNPPQETPKDSHRVSYRGPQLTPAESQAWEQAKPVLAERWPGRLRAFRSTRAHSRFLDEGRATIRWEAGESEKYCTVARDDSTIVVYEAFYRDAWLSLLRHSSGLDSAQAAAMLSVRSLSTVAHCVRDAMMRAQRKASGVAFPVGLIEDEIQHWSEQADVQAEIEQSVPPGMRQGLFRSPSTTAKGETDQFDTLAEYLGVLRRDRRALVEDVVKGYKGMASILALSRPGMVEHFRKLAEESRERMTPQDEQDLREVSAFLEDEGRYARLKARLARELASLGIDGDMICSADNIAHNTLDFSCRPSMPPGIGSSVAARNYIYRQQLRLQCMRNLHWPECNTPPSLRSKLDAPAREKTSPRIAPPRFD